MAKEFFKNLPDTSTPITASRLNGLLDGEEAMGNIVVDSIRSKNLFNVPSIFNVKTQLDIGTNIPAGTYTISGNITGDAGKTSLIIFYKDNTILKQIYMEHNVQTSNLVELDDDCNRLFLYSNSYYAESNGITSIFNNMKIEKGSIASDDYSDYINSNYKNSYSYIYDPQSSISITGKTRVNIAEGVLKAENFICKTGRILATIIGTYKSNGGVGYLALKLVNKETNEIIQLGQITSTNLTTDTCNSGSRIFNIKPGIYDIYLVGYSNNENNVLTIRAFCSLGFSVAEI